MRFSEEVACTLTLIFAGGGVIKAEDNEIAELTPAGAMLLVKVEDAKAVGANGRDIVSASPTQEKSNLSRPRVVELREVRSCGGAAM